jgi:microcystin degradation protein MlrC
VTQGLSACTLVVSLPERHSPTGLARWHRRALLAAKGVQPGPCATPVLSARAVEHSTGATVIEGIPSQEDPASPISGQSKQRGRTSTSAQLARPVRLEDVLNVVARPESPL